MSFMILPPAVSSLESYIRTLGASSLPQTQNFWFEDIPQLPAKLHGLPFQILTDYANEPHELYIDEKLFKRFVPKTGSSTVSLVLNPGIYAGRLVHLRTNATAEITFQISVRELLWWAWTQQLLSPLQRLENLELRFNSPLHLAVFEASYPQDILALQSSQWSVRAFAQTGHLKNVGESTRTFVSALMGSPVAVLSPNPELHDRRSDFSQAIYPFVDSTISRRSAFLAQDYDVVSSSSWNHGVVEDRNCQVETQVPGLTSSLRIQLFTNGIDINLANTQILGFHKERRRFSLLQSPNLVSKIVPTDPSPSAICDARIVADAAVGATHITIQITGGSASLKQFSYLRVIGSDAPVQLISDVDLADGVVGSISTAPLDTPVMAGSPFSVYIPNFEFPTLRVTQDQDAGSPNIQVTPMGSGVLQAGSRVVFNDDPNVYTVQKPVQLVLDVPTNLMVSPTPEVAKLKTHAGYPFHVTTTKVASDYYRFETSPWFLMEDLDIYCITDTAEIASQQASLFAGINDVTMSLLPKIIPVPSGTFDNPLLILLQSPGNIS